MHLNIGLFTFALVVQSVSAVSPCELAEVHRKYVGISKHYKEYAYRTVISGCWERKDRQSPYRFEFMQVANFKNKILRQFVLRDAHNNLKALKSLPKGELPEELGLVLRGSLESQMAWARLNSKRKWSLGDVGKTKGPCTLSLAVVEDPASPTGANRVTLMLKSQGKTHQLKNFGKYTGKIQFEGYWHKGASPRQSGYIAIKLIQRSGWAPGASGALNGEWIEVIPLTSKPEFTACQG